jgi:type III restriction enzyme
VGPQFEPAKPGFNLGLDLEFEDLNDVLIDLLASCQIERHIRRERDEGRNALKKEVLLTPDFIELWSRISAKTTYRVEFDSERLVEAVFNRLKQAAPLSPTVMRVTSGSVSPSRAGVSFLGLTSSEESINEAKRPIPDVIAYVQAQTDLTRATIVRILVGCGRLAEFMAQPQQFMDLLCGIIKDCLYALMIDGIKYERVPGTNENAQYAQWLFRDVEVIDYLSAVKVQNSVFEYVPYDSTVELQFARALDSRTDIKLFIKLPMWFKIGTPLGTYNPDWAIVKNDQSILYLVRETKSTREFMKLRNSERDKVRCGQAHFEALSVPFGVVVSANEV